MTLPRKGVVKEIIQDSLVHFAWQFRGKEGQKNLLNFANEVLIFLISVMIL